MDKEVVVQKNKICSKCNKILIANTANFYKDSIKKDGLSPSCADCCRKQKSKTYKNITSIRLKNERDIKRQEYLESDLFIINKQKTKEKILKLKKTKQGYLSIQLKNKGKNFLVHRLVAISFISNLNKKPQVNHINGIKNDNRVENLEWCNQSENQIHAYKNKLQMPSTHRGAIGESQGLSKLKDKDVVFILQNYKRGMGVKLSKLFNVSQTTILNVVNKKI